MVSFMYFCRVLPKNYVDSMIQGHCWNTFQQYEPKPSLEHFFATKWTGTIFVQNRCTKTYVPTVAVVLLTSIYFKF